MRIQLGLTTLVLLLLAAGCAQGTAPMEEDFRGPELTASRAAGEKRNAERLSAFKNVAPQLHQVGSGRRDECVGGKWFAEDRYYMPYLCTTKETVLLTFPGEFRDQAPKVAAALDRSTCVDGLADAIGSSLTAVTSDDVALLETVGTSCPIDTQPNYPVAISVRWSPVEPDREQLDRAASYLDGKCRPSEYCEYAALDLEARLAAAPDGDRWAAIVEFSDPYWQGEPIDG